MSRAKFLAANPRATVEGRRTNGGERYYLVRRAGGDLMPYADGPTAAKAWKAAWERYLDTDDRLRKAGGR